MKTLHELTVPVVFFLWGIETLTVPTAVLALEEWSHRFETEDGGVNDVGGRAIAVDPVGNLLVAGTSYFEGASNDFLTLKYGPDGSLLWTARRGSLGPEPSADGASAVAADSEGNVYVAGSSGSVYLTVKYSPGGEELWARGVNADEPDLDLSLELDSAGNAHVAGATAAVKYAPGGEELWTVHADEIGAGFSTADMAVDADGHVLLSGLLARPELDMALARLDPDGKLLWLRAYNGPAGLEDRAVALAVDRDGNAFVTGKSVGPDQKPNFATLKYDTDGKLLWERRWEGRGWGAEPVALALDGAGYARVAGTFVFSSGTGAGLALLKYSPEGSLDVVVEYGAEGRGEVRALAVDPAGNSYVAVRSTFWETGWDYATFMFSRGGMCDWLRRYDGPQSLDDSPEAIAIGADGSVAVTGGSTTLRGESGTRDFATVRYTFPVGSRIPGDCNDDGIVDISDGICVLGALFLGVPASLPCGEESGPGNISLLDWEGDGSIDLSDGISIFLYLFDDGPPHALVGGGTESSGCVPILGCERSTACP